MFIVHTNVNDWLMHHSVVLWPYFGQNIVILVQNEGVSRTRILFSNADQSVSCQMCALPVIYLIDLLTRRFIQCLCLQHLNTIHFHWSLKKAVGSISTEGSTESSWTSTNTSRRIRTHAVVQTDVIARAAS